MAATVTLCNRQHSNVHKDNIPLCYGWMCWWNERYIPDANVRVNNFEFVLCLARAIFYHWHTQNNSHIHTKCVQMLDGCAKKGGSTQQLTYTQNDLCSIHYSTRFFFTFSRLIFFSRCCIYTLFFFLEKSRFDDKHQWGR